MIVSDLAISRSTTILVLLAIIFISGSYSYLTLPRESEPEVVIPFVNVATTYEGVSPEDMETLVTLPLERKLTGIKGVKEITSRSVEGASSIIIEFEADFDVDQSLQKVRDKVNEAKSELPPDAEDPTITEINAAEIPVVYLALQGEVGLAVLTALAEDIEDDIESITGVLDVAIIGDVEREIRVEVDPVRVSQYGVSLTDLVAVTRQENVNTPSGAMEMGEAKYLMRVPGEFSSPDELTGLVVKSSDRGVVYLRDIATVTDGYKNVLTRSRVNGQPAVTLTVSKRAGENVIEIAEAVHAKVEEWQPRLPPTVSLGVTLDESLFVRDMVNELESGILSGLILVLVVIFVFLGFLNAIFVALAIPVSMLITFVILDLLGITLNMVVLFALILALGMLVDNGIVVVENIYRHMQAGASRVEAARAGTAEVAWPIIASTVTTIGAFFPLIFWPGMIGKFMGFLPKTVIFALTASLFVGLVVNPALASRYMRAKKGKALSDMGAPTGLVFRVYTRVLEGALRFRAVVAVTAVMSLIVISRVYFAGATIEFTPSVEPFQAFIDIDAPQGTNLDTSDAHVRRVEAMVEPVADDIDFVIANIGSRGSNARNMDFSSDATHQSRVTLDFPELIHARVVPSRIIEDLRGELANTPGVAIRIESLEMGPPVGPPVNIEISGEDYATLMRLAEEFKDIVARVPGVVDVRDDIDASKPEMKVNVDREQAWLLDLSTQFIGETVKGAVSGQVAGKYREGEDEYDVVVKFPEWFHHDPRNLENMALISQNGTPIPFGAVASIEQSEGLGSILRIDRKRAVTVSSDVAGRSGPEVLKSVKAALADYPLPAGYSVAFTGENQDSEEAQEFLGKAFAVALFFIFLTMVTQFNNLLQPLAIMTSVVLSIAGVFLGLLIFDMPFGVIMTGIGSISLAGVVVNNGIVLIDFINQLRAQGLSVQDAVVQGAVTRFRPVMLTALTTIISLVPMALGVTFDFRSFTWIVGGTTSQFWSPMAICIIFGLAFATILTLIVVPVLYSIMAGIENALGVGSHHEPA